MDKMDYYTVDMVYDLFIITTGVWVDNEEEAKRTAFQFITQDEGLPLGAEPNEYRVARAG